VIGSPGLVSRVKGIIVSPAAEWDQIDGEAATVKGLYTGYICIVAAIPAICGIIGGLLFGMAMFGVAGPMFIVPGIIGGIIGYLGTLIGVWIFALIVDALAPSFDGTKNQIQAFKVAAYAFTPLWVAGVLAIIPFLGWLAMVVGGLYALYVLYLGLPKLMRVPQDKAVGYTLVVVVVGVIIQWVVFMVAGMIVAMAGLSAVAGGAMMATHAYN
jgi:hypothetical protein